MATKLITISGIAPHGSEVTGTYLKPDSYEFTDTTLGPPPILTYNEDEENGQDEVIVTGEPARVAWWLNGLCHYISTSGLNDMGWGDDGRVDYHPTTVSFLIHSLCHSFDEATHTNYGRALYGMVMARILTFYKTEVSIFRAYDQVDDWELDQDYLDEIWNQYTQWDDPIQN